MRPSPLILRSDHHGGSEWDEEWIDEEVPFFLLNTIYRVLHVSFTSAEVNVRESYQEVGVIIEAHCR